MEAILADVTVSMSEFKKNPAAVLREANNRPVAVLNHNRAAFYMIEPQLFGPCSRSSLTRTCTGRRPVVLRVSRGL